WVPLTDDGPARSAVGVGVGVGFGPVLGVDLDVGLRLGVGTVGVAGGVRAVGRAAVVVGDDGVGLVLDDGVWLVVLDGAGSAGEGQTCGERERGEAGAGTETHVVLLMDRDAGHAPSPGAVAPEDGSVAPRSVTS